MEIARPALLGPLLERSHAGRPALVTGPPGSGKTTLLRQLRRSVEEQGGLPLYIDLMGAAASPEHFATAVLDALPAQEFSGLLPQALEIRRLVGTGRANGAQTVRALLALLASLDQAGDRPVTLLLDEVTEIRSLAYFQGLREVAQPFGAALASRRRGTILATSFPSLARRFWSFEEIALPPLSAADLQGLGSSDDAEALAQASFGWPRYAVILAESLRDHGDLTRAWAREMALGGRLETACRHTYESLLLRSRGYGISKTLLLAVAQNEGLNLTAIYRGLGRSPGATRDYLGWLLAVDALKMVRKRYYYVDGLLRHWVRLHARGRLATAAEIESTARGLVGAAATSGVSQETADVGRPRTDSLMEID